jgi:hypothetical protein
LSEQRRRFVPGGHNTEMRALKTKHLDRACYRSRNTMEEFVAKVRAAPSKLNYASVTGDFRVGQFTDLHGAYPFIERTLGRVLLEIRIVLGEPDISLQGTSNNCRSLQLRTSLG